MKESTKSNTKILIRGILSCVILVYFLFAFVLTDHLYANQRFNGFDIEVKSKLPQQFVSHQSVRDEIGEIPADSVLLSNINLSDLEHKLKDVVNIEDAKVNRTTGGKIKIEVKPVIPVARVFDKGGESYYINRQGKKLTADTRYHVDVPVISGHIDDSFLNSTELLPLLEYINSDSLWNSLTTALHIDAKHDVILIPAIKGHVVNLGNAKDKDFQDKFDRLYTIYREVLPYKGWQYYDTISVKFAGQVVATKAKKKKTFNGMLYEQSDAEEVALENMMTN